MRPYIDKSPIAAGFAATMTVVGLSWLTYAGVAQADKAHDDEVLTAEQCIDNNTTGSVEPFEEALVAEGIVNTELDRINITRGMCEEIIDRTPGGSPIARAVAVGNLTQEVQIIKHSMEDAADKDINGDGRVNAEDERIADSASFAASQAARETVRREAEEASTEGGGVGELNVEPAAYLQNAAQAQYEDGGGGAGGGGGGDAAASATAGEAQATELPSREKAQTNAASAAREKGADKKAAAAGSKCAATVTFIDHVTGRVIRGYMAFDEPAKKIHWRDHDRVELRVAPKAAGPIEQLKQELDQAEGAGTRCMQLGNQMEARFIPSVDGLDVTSLDKRKKDIRGNASTTWRWDIAASERGQHLLHLHVTTYVDTPSEEGGLRSLEPDPPVFDDYINVSATRWEVFTDFVARRWPVLVPIFLTILTAIIIPFVVPWWKRRNRPSAPRDTSSEADG